MFIKSLNGERPLPPAQVSLNSATYPNSCCVPLRALPHDGEHASQIWPPGRSVRIQTSRRCVRTWAPAQVQAYIVRVEK